MLFVDFEDRFRVMILWISLRIGWYMSFFIPYFDGYLSDSVQRIMDVSDPQCFHESRYRLAII